MENFTNILPINQWFKESISSPLIIAGPCSAESENQVISTAEAISQIPGVSIFRAGIWKPRTRPGNFEGAGNKALKWLQKVQQQTKLKVAVEVATPEHVKLCIDAGVDILWIGARTTSNPFSVQQIAEALQNCKIPVLIKNPINPDIDLWIGAIERVTQSGINKIAAVHRGFFPFEKTVLRNIPKWEIAIELMTRYPNLPVLCDPSHISGHTNYIKEISQKALDLTFEGLMIESHISPNDALSDKMQQLTPKSLGKMLKSLHFRQANTNNIEIIDKIEIFRSKIDSLDFQLLELLLQRMKVVEEIGVYKSHNNISILQLRRWIEIINTRIEYGVKLGLNNDFIKQLLQLIHDESIRKQTEILYNNSGGKSKKINT